MSGDEKSSVAQEVDNGGAVNNYLQPPDNAPEENPEETLSHLYRKTSVGKALVDVLLEEHISQPMVQEILVSFDEVCGCWYIQSIPWSKAGHEYGFISFHHHNWNDCHNAA